MTNPVCEAIRSLRNKHKLTQQELSTRAGIPRATLANMETTSGNPSIMTVVKIARALGVTVEDLVSDRRSMVVTEVKRKDMQVNRQDGGRFVSTKVSPINAPYIQMIDVNMLSGSYTKGKPHPLGAHELFMCLEGTAVIEIRGEKFEVGTGDLAYFPGNIPHTYTNPGLKPVHAISVVHMIQSNKGIGNKL